MLHLTVIYCYRFDKTPQKKVVTQMSQIRKINKPGINDYNSYPEFIKHKRVFRLWKTPFKSV